MYMLYKHTQREGRKIIKSVLYPITYACHSRRYCKETCLFTQRLPIFVFRWFCRCMHFQIGSTHQNFYLPAYKSTYLRIYLRIRLSTHWAVLERYFLLNSTLYKYVEINTFRVCACIFKLSLHMKVYLLEYKATYLPLFLRIIVSTLWEFLEKILFTTFLRAWMRRN